MRHLRSANGRLWIVDDIGHYKRTDEDNYWDDPFYDEVATQPSMVLPAALDNGSITHISDESGDEPQGDTVRMGFPMTRAEKEAMVVTITVTGSGGAGIMISPLLYLYVATATVVLTAILTILLHQGLS